MTRDQEPPQSDGAPAIRMGPVSPPRPWPGRRGPVQGGRCSEPVGQHWPPVHHWGTICRERLLPHGKPMSEKEVIGSPIATRYEYQTRAQGGLVAGKIPGSMTLRPASRAVHHRRALLARVRGQAQAQDFPAASGPRRGGCAPRRGAPGGAGRTHKPRMRGVRQHAKTRGCCSSAPAPHDGGGPEDEFNEKFYSMQAPHGRGPDSRTGARCAHTGPGHTAARRDAQPARTGKHPFGRLVATGYTHQPAPSAWRV